MGGIAVATFAGHTREDGVRIGGLVLQLLGLGTVAFGISNTRRLFHQPSLLKRGREFLGRLAAAFRAPTIVEASGVAAGRSYVTGVARATLGAHPNATLEERVAHLEQGLEDLRKDTHEDLKRVRDGLLATTNRLHADLMELGTKITRTEEQLAGLGVGGIHLEMAGLIWLCVGTAMTSSPHEILALLTSLRSVA